MSNTLDFSINAAGQYAEVKSGDMIKKISIQDLLTELTKLSESINNQDIAVSSIRTPSSIHSFSKTKSGYKINMYYEEREATLNYVDGTSYEVMMPNILVSVDLHEVSGKTSEFSIRNVYWFCTTKGRNDLPLDWSTSVDGIYGLPMPNMFGPTNMCTGSNSLPGVVYLDWTILDTLYHDILIRSNFNNDLGVRNVSGYNSPKNYFSFLQEEHKNGKGFPYSIIE